jgi:DNA mismatch repair protein MSH3
VTFLYKLTPGIAHRSYGYDLLGEADFRLNVARLANLPEHVITVAGEKSKAMEEETKLRELQRWYLLF